MMDFMTEEAPASPTAQAEGGHYTSQERHAG
jgi:hypothetical protein